MKIAWVFPTFQGDNFPRDPLFRITFMTTVDPSKMVLTNILGAVELNQNQGTAGNFSRRYCMDCRNMFLDVRGCLGEGWIFYDLDGFWWILIGFYAFWWVLRFFFRLFSKKATSQKLRPMRFAQGSWKSASRTSGTPVEPIPQWQPGSSSGSCQHWMDFKLLDLVSESEAWTVSVADWLKVD